MSRQDKSFVSGYIFKLIVGLALMFGGMYVSVNFQPEFLRKLADQGLPIDLGKTVSYIGVLLILFPVIKQFFIDPLSTAITNRTVELEKTFSEAENLRAQMDALKADYEQRLAATEAEARETIQKQIHEAQELRGELMAEAASKADELVKKAQQEIEQEKVRALSELRVRAIDMTLVAAEKLIGENMDSDKNRKLVGEFIDKVEVNN